MLLSSLVNSQQKTSTTEEVTTSPAERVQGHRRHDGSESKRLHRWHSGRDDCFLHHHKPASAASTPGHRQLVVVDAGRRRRPHRVRRMRRRTCSETNSSTPRLATTQSGAAAGNCRLQQSWFLHVRETATRLQNAFDAFALWCCWFIITVSTWPAKNTDQAVFKGFFGGATG